MSTKKFVFDGSQRHFFELGNLVITQTTEVTQHHKLSILGSKLIDGLFEGRGQLGVFEVSKGVLGLVLDHEFDLIAVAITTVQRDRFQLSPTKVIDPEIVADSKKPGRKPVLRVESLERRPGADKRLLGQLPGKLHISDQLGQKRRQTSLVAPHQGGERILIPIQGEADELLVGGIGKAHNAS